MEWYNLYFLDNTLFANDFERVVHGNRGDYIELSKKQIEVNLISKFGQPLPNNIPNELFYYYWLIPEGRDEKIYWQVNTVDYADYKSGYYYISPKLLKPFNEKKRKFFNIFE